MYVRKFKTRQIKTRCQQRKKYSGKYSAKPGIEPELSRPKQNHYIHSPIALLTRNSVHLILLTQYLSAI